MKAIIRKDEQAVSPVIATILMVAITVVLAAVLYVMVSGLITSPGSTPKQVGATVVSSGGNGILTVTSVSATMSASQTFLTIQKLDGTSTNTTAVALTALVWGTNGAKYQAAGSTGNVAAADTILLSQTAWGAGLYRITMTNGGSIVYGPTTLS